jgi:hypothetical protein
MQEAEIRKRALEILNKEKWVCWFPKKVRFHETDIWGIADLICCQKKKIKLIQLTTLSNVSRKRKKITSFLKKFKVELPIEIWAYSKKNKKFIIEKCLRHQRLERKKRSRGKLSP